MITKRHRDALERDIEAALAPGRPRAWVGDPEFPRRLEETRRAISVLATGDRAAGLLETFVAGCLAKVPEVDDALGRFARFVERLVADWIGARRRADSDPAETAVTLVTWIEDDDHGILLRFRLWGAETLDEAGRGALEMVLRLWSEGLERGSPEHRRAAAIRKGIRVRDGDPDAYATLCEEADGPSPRDCEALAVMCRARGRFRESLAWADRGLILGEDGDWGEERAWNLPRRRREALADLGRMEQAREAAWEAFLARPRVALLEELVAYVPEAEREEWRGRALAALLDAPLGPGMRVLLATGEDERLARLVSRAAWEDLCAVSHLVNGPAAERLVARSPQLAARLHAAMAFRMLHSGKKIYYGRVLDRLREARALFRRHGESAAWDLLAEAVRERCRGKPVFMRRFEAQVAGVGTSRSGG